MRVSRAPEGRSRTKRIAIGAVGIAAVIAAVAVFLFTSGSDSISAKDAEGIGAQSAVATNPTNDNLTVAPVAAPTPEPTPTAVPAPTPAPEPTPVSDDSKSGSADEGSSAQAAPDPTAQPSSASTPNVLPEAYFGEILEEGLMELRYPRGEMVKTWYTFQVDTETRDITLFFAQYDDGLESIVSTVKVDNYTKGGDLGNAEVRLNYPDGSTRTLFLDRDEGSINLNQQYMLPVGPSMLSSDLRRALVYYGIKLQNDSADTQVELHLDLSGLTQSEGLEFTKIVPDTVDDVLQELQFLVEQIEDERIKP